MFSVRNISYLRHLASPALRSRSTRSICSINESNLRRNLLKPDLNSPKLSPFSTESSSESDKASDNKSAHTEKDPLSHPDFFGVHKLFTIEDLFNARVHLGHTPRTLDRRMRQFVFGSRFDTLIIDLDQTALLLRQALNFTAQIAAKGQNYTCIEISI